jgi:tetratricopeptide (TPR) repeat protein
MKKVNNIYLITALIIVALPFQLWFAKIMMDRKKGNFVSYSHTVEISIPKTVYGDYLSGAYTAKNGDMDRASTFFMDALRQETSDSRILEDAYVTTLLSGKLNSALSIVREYGKDTPNSITGYLPLAFEAIINNDFKKAKELIEKDKENDSKPLTRIINSLIFSWCQVGLKEYSEAINTLKSLGKNENKDDIFKLQIALIHDLDGDYKAAEALYKEVAKDFTDYTDILLAANFYERTNNTEKAKELYIKYNQVNPFEPLFVSDIKRLEENKPTNKRIVENAKEGIAYILIQIADLFYDNGLFTEALIYAQMIHFLDSNFDEASILIGKCYDQFKKPKQALKYYKIVLETSRLYKEALFLQSIDLNKLNDKEKAKKILLTLSENEDNYLKSIIYLADLYREETRYKEAIEALNKVINTLETKDYHWNIFYARAVNYDLNDEHEKAEVDYIKALELNPNNPSLMNDLGYNWIERGKNIDKAVELIRKSLEKTPSNPQTIDSMGWALYMQGKYDEAVDFLEAALEILPNDYLLNDHLGDIYYRLGREIEAEFQWNHAIEFCTDKKEIEKIKQKLAKGLPPHKIIKS